MSMARTLVPTLCLGLLLTALPPSARAEDASLATVQTIYVLPMSSGIDQFIAHQVARHHVYQVTTDPLQADAFLSDFVGASFEMRVDDLLKTAREKAELAAQEEAKKEQARKEQETSKKTDAKGKDNEKSKDAKDKDTEDTEAPGGFQTAGAVTRIQSFGRGKGNVFLVDAKSRRVLWTGFDIAKNTRAESLQKSASRLVSQLRKVKSGK